MLNDHVFSMHGSLIFLLFLENAINYDTNG